MHLKLSLWIFAAVTICERGTVVLVGAHDVLLRRPSFGPSMLHGVILLLSSITAPGKRQGTSNFDYGCV